MRGTRMSKVPRIAVVGSANVDLTTFSDRFPRPGETIFGQRFDLGFGGKGANQAVAARLCGADVVMVAKLGNDLFGEATVKNFASLGIDTKHVRIVDGVSSGVAPIFVEPNGQNRIDRKSTRLNSSHQIISYDVFCLKKKKNLTVIDISSFLTGEERGEETQCAQSSFIIHTQSPCAWLGRETATSPRNHRGPIFAVWK